MASSNKKLSIEVPDPYRNKGWAPAPELQKAIQDTADVYENLPFMPEKYPKLKVNVVPEKGTAYLPSGTVGAHYQAVPAHLLPKNYYRYWLGLEEPDMLGIHAADDSIPTYVSSTFAHELGHADNDRLTRFFQEHPQILAEFPRYTDPKGDWYSRDRSFARSPKSRSAWVQEGEFPSIAQGGANIRPTVYFDYFYKGQPDREYHHLSAADTGVDPVYYDFPAPQQYYTYPLLGGVGGRTVAYTPYNIPADPADPDSPVPSVKNYKQDVLWNARNRSPVPDKLTHYTAGGYAGILHNLRGGYLPENWTAPKDTKHGWDVSNTAHQWMNPRTRGQMEKITRRLRDRLDPYAEALANSGSNNQPLYMYHPSNAEVFQRLNEHVATADFNPTESVWNRLPYYKMVMLEQQILDAQRKTGYSEFPWLPQPKRMTLLSPEWYRQHDYAKSLESTDPKNPFLKNPDRRKWESLNPYLYPFWEKIPGGARQAQLMQFMNPNFAPESFKPAARPTSPIEQSSLPDRIELSDAPPPAVSPGTKTPAGT